MVAPVVSNQVNKHAVKKYGEFQQAIAQVKQVLDDSTRVLSGMRDSGNHPSGWRIPDKKELSTLKKRAEKQLQTLRAASKKYEAELIANGWKV
ncbi:hypothetical protein [Sciscionella marina]|uniref:hypothetical protein n=1 Tax=Sciscionella marina TaxID=508770 RepID=UPI00036409B4|nr:hypothetical protein [Sciscionella marina]